MIYVSASQLSASDMALLGNNILPGRRLRRDPEKQAKRRVLRAVNRSLALVQEQVDHLDPLPMKFADVTPAIAS